jgi:hypothetical protein
MDTVKNIGRVLLFLAIVILHIYFSREAHWLSWITPFPAALLFTAATYGLQDLSKPWNGPKEDNGARKRNGSRYILLFMTIALYLIGIIDRG